MTFEYLAKIKEVKDAEPHAGQYKVFHVTCPFCEYECEVHAVHEFSVWSVYPKCHICRKKFMKEKE